MAYSCPELAMSERCTLLTPPGKTRPSIPTKSSAVRRYVVSCPSRANGRWWSAKAPWSAKIPMRTMLLPTSRSESLIVAHAARCDAEHGLAETGADLRQLLGILPVRGGCDDRACAPRRVLAQ